VADGPTVRPVAIGTGATDGLATEIANGALRDGDAVVIGERTAAERDAESSPFTPRLFGARR